MNKFKIGDFVEIIDGQARGRRGFVKHVHKEHGCWHYEIDTACGFVKIFEDYLRLVDLVDMDKAFKKIDDLTKSCTFINGVAYIPLHIENVIFNNPATIVFWSDGSKTIVKCAGDEAFDEEKGLAMAISKKVLGNKGNYYNEFKKWLPEIEVCENKGMTMVEACKKAHDAVENFNRAMKGEK